MNKSESSELMNRISKLRIGDEELTETLNRIINLAKANPKFYQKYKDFLDPEEIDEIGRIVGYMS